MARHATTSRANKPTTGRRGFTLIEVLAVVVVLGIAAAIVLPQFAGYVEQAMATALQVQTVQANKQVDQYRALHGSPTLTSFASPADNQSTSETSTSEAGPKVVLPANPNTGGNSVGAGEPGTSDWVFDARSGRVIPNDLQTLSLIKSHMSTLISAIRAYAQKNGRNPNTLTDLKGEVISESSYDAAIRDPRTGQPFLYVKPDSLITELDEPGDEPVLFEQTESKVLIPGLVGFADGSVQFVVDTP